MGIQELENDMKFLKEQFEGVDKSKKTKKFRYPLGKKVGKAQKKKNYVTLFKINENGTGVIKKVQIKEQTFIEEGVPRLAAAGYVTYVKKNPWIILPSWSVKPFSAMENYEESLKDGSNKVGFRLLMNIMQLEGISSKKQMGGMLKWILGIGLAIVIAYAFLTGSG